MTVLSYPAGKPLNWSEVLKNPNRVKMTVRWDRLSLYGKVVRGSLFAIAALDEMNNKALVKFSRSVTVVQTCFNTTIAASAGTHDFDYCMDWWISGLDGFTQQHFGRFDCGWACWYRRPSQGFPNHIHGFPLPPGGHKFPTTVGYYVDGGVSLYGRQVTSSQIIDYWNESYGLAGLHYQSADPSAFPTDKQKAAKIFKLDAYIKRQIQKTEEQDMEYKDWSDKSKKELAGDIADAVSNRILDVESVVLQKDGEPDKKIPIRNGLQRTLNNTE